MRAYALRDKATGLYLMRGRKGRHNSYASFSSLANPRLFSRKAAATNCMKAWYAGKWGWRTWMEEADLKPRLVPSRKLVQIEIVEFDLVPVIKG
jgi:hypothetical protein